MKNSILKLALITVAAIAAAGILIFSMWILISPQSMATSSEKLGNYNFAVTCANLKYKYSSDTGDLARCAEDSILSKKDKLIIKYCGELRKKSDFDALCSLRNEELSHTQFGSYATDYRTYILGNLAVAQYRSGDLQAAVKTAEEGEKECFKKLVIEILVNGTEADKVNIINSIDPQRTDAIEYVKELLNLK